MIVTIAVYSVAILTLPAAFANNGLWASYLILVGGRVVTLGFQWRRQPLPF